MLINKQESDLLTLKTRSSPREDTDYPRHQQIPSTWEGNVARETNIIPLRHKNTFLIIVLKSRGKCKGDRSC